VVDEDSSHHLRRDAKEVRAILPIDVPLIDEPNEHLVYKGGRLQRVVGTLVPKLAQGDAAELLIDDWQQLVERSSVAATPIAEQCRHVVGRDQGTLLGWTGAPSIAPRNTTRPPPSR